MFVTISWQESKGQRGHNSQPPLLPPMTWYLRTWRYAFPSTLFFFLLARVQVDYKHDCLWKYQYACVHRNVCAFSELFVSLSKVVSVCAWLLQVYMCLFVCMSVCAVRAFMQDFGLLNYDLNLLCVLSVSVNSPDSLCFSPQYKHWWKQRAHTEGCASASWVPLSWLSVFKQTGGPSLIYWYS